MQCSKVPFANSRGNGRLGSHISKRIKSNLGNLIKSEFHLQWFYSCKNYTSFQYGDVVVSSCFNQELVVAYS